MNYLFTFLVCCCWTEKFIPTSPACCSPPGRILTPTENHRVWRLPVTHNDPVRLTMATHAHTQTHTHCCVLAPCCTPPPTLLSSFGSPLMDCFLHLQCLACAVASQDARQPLGTALFFFSLTLHHQIVSNSTHYPPYLISTILCCLLFFFQHWQMSSRDLHAASDFSEKPRKSLRLRFLFKRWRKKQEEGPKQ